MQYVSILLKLKKKTPCKIENIKENLTFGECSLDVACSLPVLEPVNPGW